MAMIALPYLASYTFRDNNGKESTSQIQLQATAAPNDAVLAASSIANNLQTLSNATLVRFSVSRVFEETQPAVPANESEVERKLVMVFKSGNRQTVIVTVPSAHFGLELPGTNLVDYSNNFFGAVRTALTTGVENVPFVSNANSPISSFERAYIMHRYRKP